jgi:hypothetical protein
LITGEESLRYYGVVEDLVAEDEVRLERWWRYWLSEDKTKARTSAEILGFMTLAAMRTVNPLIQAGIQDLKTRAGIALILNSRRPRSAATL